jgi:hypothetical protein
MLMKNRVRLAPVGVWGIAAMLALALTAGPLAAEESLSPAVRPNAEATPPDAEDGEDPAPAPSVKLDSLLKLPSDMSFQNERRHGASAEEWKSRFRESHAEIVHAQEELVRMKDELDELAGDGGGGQWNVAPPGSNQTEVQPMSYKLREELKRGRARLDEAERRHRQLEVEADLAGVPRDWRGAGS